MSPRWRGPSRCSRRPDTALQLDRPRRLIVIGLVAAALATASLVLLAPLVGRPEGTSSTGLIDEGQPAPAIIGTTLDGASFDLAALRGKPVIVNFWGPSCVPCRDEFPLFIAKLDEHEADGLTIVGVLMYDSPATALDFVREFGATWSTVNDPDGEIRATYRVALRPLSYFIDPDGILRAIQVGEVTAEQFERKYALIRPGAPARSTAGSPAPAGE